MSQPTNPPLASTRSELRHLRDHSQATVAELKAFLAEMKGRSPQEMLGMVAANALVQALVQATVVIALIVAIFTLIPYFTRGEDKPAVVEQPIPAAPPESKETPIEEPATAPEAALETLGIGEEKSAPADANPLDTDTGSFLDELE